MPNTLPNDQPISAKFNDLRSRREGALVAYLTGGDPDPKTFLSNARALIEGGADILEVGIPFSDPIADGPVIQASSHRALSSGVTPRKVLDLTRELSSYYKIPMVVLTYYNPILALGPDKFMKDARDSGVNGLVIADLPVEESGPLQQLAHRYRLDLIFLAAPNTSSLRLRRIIEQSRGFLYLVSLFGVTGPRKLLSPRALEAVKRVRMLARGRIPIAAGFGVSRPEHVSDLLASGADGAIVGSALVQIVSEHLDDPEAAEGLLKTTVSELKNATRRRSN